MQRSAFIIALFSLFAFFSLALASPLPVQVKREVTDAAVELSAREVPAEHEILLRELSTDVESGAELQIVAREHKAFEDYVREITDEANIQDVKPRICQHQLCF